MYTLNFDCRSIHNDQDFYHQLTQQYSNGQEFGNSLDALWDWLTGELPLPLTLNFCALQTNQFAKGEPLASIIALLLEAQEILSDQISITVNQRPFSEWVDLVHRKKTIVRGEY